jgi:hypothetical protein
MTLAPPTPRHSLAAAAAAAPSAATRSSPGRQSHSDTTLCISLGVLHTKYTQGGVRMTPTFTTPNQVRARDLRFNLRDPANHALRGRLLRRAPLQPRHNIRRIRTGLAVMLPHPDLGSGALSGAALVGMPSGELANPAKQQQHAALDAQLLERATTSGLPSPSRFCTYPSQIHTKSTGHTFPHSCQRRLVERRRALRLPGVQGRPHGLHAGVHRPGRRGRLRALRAFHRKSILHGVFCMGAHGA